MCLASESGPMCMFVFVIRVTARFSLPLRTVDTVVEDKLAFKLVNTTGHCSTVHGKFLIVLDFLVPTTSTDTLASKGTQNL